MRALTGGLTIVSNQFLLLVLVTVMCFPLDITALAPHGQPRHNAANNKNNKSGSAASKPPQAKNYNPKSEPSSRRQKPPRAQNDRRRESLDYGNDPLVSLNMNLDALANSGAADRAQELYQRIAALHSDGYYPVSPDVVSFNSVLKAWQAEPSRALEFWERVVQEERTIEPNVRSFNTFLAALAKAGLSQQAHELLLCMKEPNAAVIPDRVTYNTVLGAYAASPEADSAGRAEVLLEEMIASEEIPSPDVVSYNTVLAAWAGHGTQASASKAAAWLDRMPKPDVTSYTTVLSAHARCRQVDEAQAVWKRLQAAVAATTNDVDRQRLVPNRVTYTTVMQALCQAQRPNEAMQILNDMFREERPEARPDCVAVSALMDGYLKADPWTAWTPVSQLLQRMKQEGVVPNGRTYTTVLAALARAGLPDGPERALLILQEIAKETPVLVFHQNAALAVCSKARSRGKALHVAKSIWDGMVATNTKPDVITYNTALATIAASASDPLAWPWALSLWNSLFGRLSSFGVAESPEEQELTDDTTGNPINTRIRPTSLTFLYWFQILTRLPESTLSQSDLVEWKKAAVLECSRAEVWNERVWKPATEACRPEELTSWLQAAADILLLDAGGPSTIDDEELAVQKETARWICPISVTVSELPKVWKRQALPERPRK